MHEPANTLDEMEMALGDSGIICPLARLGMLQVSGSDALTFLQNQLTQDVTRLDGSRSVLAAWCNAKGRARAVFRVVPTEDGAILLADAQLLEALRPTLQMFILRAQVTLTPLSPEAGAMGMAGPTAERLLTEAAGSLPDRPDGLSRAGDLQIVALPGPQGLRYLVMAPADQLAALRARFRDALTEGDEAFWLLQSIRAGIPALTRAVSETVIPTMLNLEPLNGISFEKGCYPGQEVIARMHYRGQLKRRLYRASLADDPPAPGTTVEDADGQEAGVIINAAPASGGGSEVLAVLRIEKTDQPLAVDDRALTLLDLPYTPPQ